MYVQKGTHADSTDERVYGTRVVSNACAHWDVCAGKVCACQCNVHADARIRCAHSDRCMRIRMHLSSARHVNVSNALLRKGKIIPLLANSGNMDCSIHWAGEARRLLTRQMYLSQHYVCRGSARYPHFKTIMLLVQPDSKFGS